MAAKTITPRESRDASSVRISEDRIGELLDTAAEVFYERGFAAASVGEMARRANASKGTYYSRYPSKEDLFRAIIQRGGDQTFGSFAETLQSERPVADILHDFSQALLHFTLEKQSVSLLRLLYMEGIHFPDLGKSFYEHGIGRLQTLFQAFLQAQVKRGTLRIENSRITSEQFMDALVAEPVRRAVLGIHPPFTRSDLALRVRIVVEALLAAHAPSAAKRG